MDVVGSVFWGVLIALAVVWALNALLDITLRQVVALAIVAAAVVAGTVYLTTDDPAAAIRAVGSAARMLWDAVSGISGVGVEALKDELEKGR